MYTHWRELCIYMAVINIRVDDVEKLALETTAKLRNLTLSAYMLTSARESIDGVRAPVDVADHASCEATEARLRARVKELEAKVAGLEDRAGDDYPADRRPRQSSGRKAEDFSATLKAYSGGSHVTPKTLSLPPRVGHTENCRCLMCRPPKADKEGAHAS